MRYFNSLALMAGLWFVACGLPTLRADDDVSRVDEIIDRVSQTLEASDLSEQQKQTVLGELRKSLAATMKPDDTTEESPARPLGRSAQRAQQPSDQAERSPADARRRAEAMRRQAEGRPREMLREWGPQIGRQFAIGVMLERAVDPGAKGELLISEVFPGSPAAQAGLKAGDVIVKVDGDAVADLVEMTRRIRTAGMDDQSLSLEVSRDEQVLTFDLKPTLQPRDRAPLGFGRWDWEMQFPPGMPGGRGFSDPGWRFPTAPPGREIGDSQRIRDVISQIEMQQEQLNELQERVGAVEEAIQQDQKSTDH